jgi:hypothetical protein
MRWCKNETCVKDFLKAEQLTFECNLEQNIFQTKIIYMAFTLSKEKRFWILDLRITIDLLIAIWGRLTICDFGFWILDFGFWIYELRLTFR